MAYVKITRTHITRCCFFSFLYFIIACTTALLFGLHCVVACIPFLIAPNIPFQITLRHHPLIWGPRTPHLYNTPAHHTCRSARCVVEINITQLLSLKNVSIITVHYTKYLGSNSWLSERESWHLKLATKKNKLWFLHPIL